MRLTEQQAEHITALHRRHIAESIKRRGTLRLIYDHLDLESLHSVALFACSCTDNPDCTGFVFGIRDIENVRNAIVMPTGAQLLALAHAILMEHVQ